MTDRSLGEHFNAQGRPKRRFRNKEKAEQFVRQQRIVAVVYHCSFCYSWHFSTSDGRSLRK